MKSIKSVESLNYFDHFHVFVSTISGCVSMSTVVSLVGVSVGTASSAVRLKICAITTAIKNYKSIIKKIRKSMII